MSLVVAGNEAVSREEESTGILTNEQIEQLLQEAEKRLRNASDSALPHHDETSSIQDIIAVDTVTKRKPLPKLTHGLRKTAYIEEKDGIAQADERRLLGEKQRKLSNVLRAAEIDQLLQGKPKKNDRPTAGAEWFDLPKTVLTPQLKRDLQIIEMRSVLDPHRHYKKTSGKNKVPAFSEVGTIIEGPTEWFSSRINRKDRAKTFVEEVMAGERETGRFKRKYDEIQDKKTSGKKAHYKGLMDKRKKRK